jgi:hypothetical protein
MKKILIPILFLSSTLWTACEININAKAEPSTILPAEGKTFDVKPFKAIKADGVFNIILSQGSKESVVVKGKLPKGLSISNAGDTLVITDTIDGNISNHSVKTDIYLTLVDINSMVIESVGETTCSDTLKLKTLDFHAEGVGATTLWLNIDSVHAEEDGVGKLTLAGKATSAKIENDGVGALEAKAFKVDVLHASISGVGAAKVYATKEIYMECSGVGGVQYSGPAKVMQNESSGVGKVEHAD